MNRDQRALKVMEGAFELPTDEQAAYVEQACAGDSALLHKVRALLNAVDEQGDFLATRSDDDSTSANDSGLERIGDYRILRQIGRGGMGVVYEAEHDAMQRRVALKVLAASDLPSKSQVTRFYREARAAGQLHHTNIVPVFEVGSADGLHYYTMQFIQGANLDLVIAQIKELRGSSPSNRPSLLSRTIAANLLSESDAPSETDSRRQAKEDLAAEGPPATAVTEEIKRSSGRLAKHLDRAHGDGRQAVSDSSGSVSSSVFDSDWSSSGKSMYYRRVAAIGVQTADALHYAHQNKILHRDIKPANLILDTLGVVWVLDFGLAKSGDENLTMTGDVIGTLRYMAPERFEGNADARSDVYSLGLTLYELATLEHAFEASNRATLVKQMATEEPPTPRSVDPRIPRDLETIILKSMERNPNRRYHSAEEMAEDLRLFLMDHPISARRISPMERMMRICRRNPVVSALTLLVAAMLVVIAIGSSRFAYLSNQQTQQAVRAEKSTRLRRYELNYEHAQATRLSGQLGSRFEAIASIKEAVELLPTLELSPERVEEERSKLRSEAVSALGQVDIRPDRSWNYTDRFKEGGTFSYEYDTLARVDETNNEIHLLDVDKRVTDRVIPGTYGTVYSVQFSPCGKYVSSTHPKNMKCIWALDGEANPDEPLLSRKSHYRATIAFAKHNGLAAVSMPKSVELHTLPNTEAETTLRLEFSPGRMQFSDAERQIAVSAMNSRVIQIWDFSNEPRMIRKVEYPEQYAKMRTFSWSSDRGILVAGLNDGKILVWRNGFDQPPEPYELHQHTIVAIRIHPTQPLILTGAWDNTTRVFDLAMGKQVLKLERFGLRWSDFSRDGTRIGLSSSEHRTIGIWRLPESLVNRFRIQTAGLTAANVHRRIFIHPVFSDLVVTANSKRIEFWNRRNGKLVFATEEFSTPFINLSQDGQHLFVFGAAGVLRIPLRISSTQVPSGIELTVALDTPTTLLAPQPGASKFFLSPTEDSIVVTYRENADSAYAKLFHFSDVEDPIEFAPHKQMSNATIAQNGRWVVSTSWKSTGVCIWDATSGELLTTLLPDKKATFAEFSPDSQLLVVAQSDAIHIWKSGTWTSVPHELTRKYGIMGDMEFHRQSNLLATNQTGYVPQLIDYRNNRWIMNLESSLEFRARHYSFSHDGSALAIGGKEFATIWNLAGMREQLRALELDW